MMFRWALVAWVGLGAAACESVEGTGSTSSGTSVGNPSLIAARLAPSADVTVSSAMLPVEQLWVETDAGMVSVLDAETVFDLVDGPPVPVNWSGEGSRFSLVASGPLVLDGTTTAGAEVSISLDIGAVVLTVVDEADPGDDARQFVLELGFPGWLNAEEASYELDEGLVVDVEDDRHEDLVRVVEDGSALYEDDDGDTVVTSDERDEETASGSDRPAVTTDDAADDDTADDDVDTPDREPTTPADTPRDADRVR